MSTTCPNPPMRGKLIRYGRAMFALVVRFRLRDGHAAEFDALVAETLAGIRDHEPGTLVYATHTGDDPQIRVFYECYRDPAAFDAHEGEPHTRRFLREREQHLAEAPDVAWLTANGMTSRIT